jgi:hypothetical protein
MFWKTGRQPGLSRSWAVVDPGQGRLGARPVVGTTATGRDASSDELRKALDSSYPGHPKLQIRALDSGAHEPSRAARAAAPATPVDRVTCSLLAPGIRSASRASCK